MENNKIIAVIGGLVAIGLVVGGLIAFTGNNNESDSANNNQTSQSMTSTEEPAAETQSNIVELAQSTEELSTLVTAVETAGLVETLSGEGPYTVFAPTNDAFEALLEELNVTAEELLARDDLADILTYHVVVGEVMAADLSDGQVIDTVQGGKLTVSVSDAGVVLTDANGNKAKVTTADVKASNGVVHIIDAVVLP